MRCSLFPPYDEFPRPSFVLSIFSWSIVDCLIRLHLSASAYCSSSCAVPIERRHTETYGRNVPSDAGGSPLAKSCAYAVAKTAQVRNPLPPSSWAEWATAIAAIRLSWPRSLHQRFCLHVCSNRMIDVDVSLNILSGCLEQIVKRVTNTEFNREIGCMLSSH